MEKQQKDSIHAICQIITHGCREHVTRLCAILHTMDEESLDVAREAIVRTLVSMDNDLCSMEKWLGIATCEDTDLSVQDIYGFKEAGASVPLHSAPKTSQKDLCRQERSAIPVHPPPKWVQMKIQD